MSTVNWIGGSGNWTDYNWSGTSTYPSAGDDVTISASGNYQITISDAEFAQSLVLADSGATVFDEGTLTLSGNNATLNLTAGAFFVGYNALIVGGTIIDPNSALAISSGGLWGVTYEGTLNIAPQTTVYIVDGLTLEGVGGTGPGAIDVGGGGGGANLQFLNTQTLSEGTINLQGVPNSNSYAPVIADYDTSGLGTAVLTFGESVVINSSQSPGVAGTNEIGSNTSNGNIVNEGTINDLSGVLQINT